MEIKVAGLFATPLTARGEGSFWVVLTDGGFSRYDLATGEWKKLPPVPGTHAADWESMPHD